MVVLYSLTWLQHLKKSFEVFETERETDQNYTFRALLEGKKEQNRNRKFVMEFVRTLGQKDEAVFENKTFRNFANLQLQTKLVLNRLLILCNT